MPETIHTYAQLAPRGALESITLPALEAPRGHDIDVAHCSVCHSDVHLLDGEWGEQPRPFVAGHEIVGRVTRHYSKGAVVQQEFTSNVL